MAGVEDPLIQYFRKLRKWEPRSYTLLLFVVSHIQSIVLVANPKIQNTARSASSQTAAVTFAVELSLQRVKDDGIFFFYEPVIRAGCSIVRKCVKRLPPKAYFVFESGRLPTPVQLELLRNPPKNQF